MTAVMRRPFASPAEAPLGDDGRSFGDKFHRLGEHVRPEPAGERRWNRLLEEEP